MKFEKASEAKSGAAKARTPGKRTVALRWCAVCLVATALATLVIHLVHRRGAEVHATTPDDLLRLPPARLSKVPTAELNLICGSGLFPANEADVRQCLGTIEVWAQRVQSETERHQYRFERNPAEFENSAAFFRMLMLAVVLAEDYGVHYDAARREKFPVNKSFPNSLTVIPCWDGADSPGFEIGMSPTGFTATYSISYNWTGTVVCQDEDYSNLLKDSISINQSYTGTAEWPPGRR